MHVPFNVPHRTEAANRLAHGPFRMPRIIVTERLMLCPLEMHHLGPFAQFSADPEATRFLNGPTDTVGALVRLGLLAGQWPIFGFGHYAICNKDGAFLGATGLYMPIEWPEIEVAYFLLPSAQGKGYAAEAVSAMRDEAARRGVPTLVSYIDPSNTPSIALAERVGATCEGSIVLRGKDAICYRHTMPNIAQAEPAEDIPYLEPQAMPERIATPRLTLSAWRARHFEPFAELLSDEDTTRYLSGVVARGDAWRSMVAGAGAWALRGYGTYAIEHEGRFAGLCGLYRPHDWPQIEMAYTLAPHARGKGFASEAVLAVRGVAAAQGIDTLESYIHPDNEASIAVAERVGAVSNGEAIVGGDTVIIYRHPMEKPALAATEPA